MGWRLGLARGLQETRGHHLSMSHCEAMHDGCIAGGSKALSRARVELGGWFLICFQPCCEQWTCSAYTDWELFLGDHADDLSSPVQDIQSRRK